MDCVWEVIDLACDLGLIEKSASWFNLSYMEEPKKLQGQKKVWDFLRENKDEYDKLLSMVKELM